MPRRTTTTTTDATKKKKKEPLTIQSFMETTIKMTTFSVGILAMILLAPVIMVWGYLQFVQGFIARQKEDYDK